MNKLNHRNNLITVNRSQRTTVLSIDELISVSRVSVIRFIGEYQSVLLLINYHNSTIP